MFVRDPFIVIGDKLILCNMKEDFRKQELKTLEQILKKIDSSNINTSSPYIFASSIITSKSFFFFFTALKLRYLTPKS